MDRLWVRCLAMAWTLVAVGPLMVPNPTGPGVVLARTTIGRAFRGNPARDQVSVSAAPAKRLSHRLRPHGSPASGPDQPGFTCSGSPTLDDSTVGYKAITTTVSWISKPGGSVSGDIYNYTATDDYNSGYMHTDIEHDGNGFGHWIEGYVSALSMVPGAFDWGFDTQANFPFNYNMIGLQWNGSQWKVHYNQNNYLVPSIQPGLNAYLAEYIDCHGVAHIYLGAQQNNVTEVYKTPGTLTSGQNVAYYVASSFHVAGRTNASVSIADQRYSNGIPPDMTINNWNGGGTTVTGSGYLPGSGASPAASDSPSVSSTHCSCGDPIDTATGAFLHTFPDLAIPGRGVSLDFTHSYNSLDATQDGPLGYGWTDSYNLFLSEDSSGNITVHEENGSAVTFTATNPGYQPPGYVLASLTDNGDGTLTFTRRDQIQYVFTAPTSSTAGQLLREVDRNGYTTSLSYTNGLLSTVTDPAGRSLSLTYNTSNRLASVSDESGRQASFGYDGSGNLTDVTDVRGGHWHFTYDANHYLLTMQDPRQYPSGPVTTNLYDSSGRVTQQTDPLNHSFTFAYLPQPDGTSNTKITDPNGNVTIAHYNGTVMTAMTQAYGTAQQMIWHFGYDPTTLHVTSVDDPAHRTWLSSWDSHGNLLSSTAPQVTGESSLRTWSATYNAFNEILTATDPTNVTTTYTYDTRGNLTSVSRPIGSTGSGGPSTSPVASSPNCTIANVSPPSTTSAEVILQYGDASHPGDVTSMTDPNGHVTAFTYDAGTGNLTQTCDPLGNATTYGYDTVGRVTSVVSPKGNIPPANPADYTTQYTYNAADQVTSVTDPLSNTTAATYDADGNLSSVADTANHTTSYTYDAANRLTQVTQPDTSTESTTYDADGNVTAQTDGLNQTTGYAYDALNRVISRTDPKNRVWQYTYALPGVVKTILDPMSRTTTYGYNEVNELTSVTYSDGTTPNVTYAYNRDGMRTSMTDGTGTSSYSYDSLNRLTQSKDGAGKIVGYAYDLAGNLTQLTYPDQSTVTRRYDEDDRPVAITDWLQQTTSFGYDPNSNLVSQTYPNTVAANFTFDHADQLTQIADSQGGNSLWTFGYGRSNLGQVSTASDPIASSSHTYGYDSLNRLTGDQTGGSNNTAWSYDAANQLTGISGSSIPSSALTYDAAGELTTLTQGTSPSFTKNLSLTYNANGDRTGETDSVSSTSSTFGYDQADRLTSYTSGATSASYTYNGDGLRVGKTVNGTATGEVWDVAEGLPVIVQDGTTKYVNGPGGLPLEQVDGSGTVLYYVQDQLGSTRALLDGSGNVVATYTYDAYGNLTGSTGTVTTPFGYAGQYTDSESGLQYLRARHYDPSTQQFLTLDPLVGVTGQGYEYGMSNPANSVDPSGLLCVGPVPIPSTADTWHTCVGKGAKDLGYVAPDYISISFTGAVPVIPPIGPGATIGFTYTRTGHLYFSVGGGLGTSGASVELRGGHILGAHTRCDVDAFVSGQSVTASGMVPINGLLGPGPTAGVTWGNPGQYTPSGVSAEGGIGYGTVGAAIMGTYSWRISPPLWPRQGPSW